MGQKVYDYPRKDRPQAKVPWLQLRARMVNV